MNEHKETQRGTLYLAVLGDLHYLGGEPPPSLADRMKGLGPEHISASVARLQREGTPDLLVLPGDLVEDGEAPGAEAALKELRRALHKTGIPFITTQMGIAIR